jgi:hypothetical protein
MPAENYFAELDPVRALVLQLVAEKGADLAQVSRAIGKNHAYLQQFLKRGKPRLLPEVVRENLGRYFGVDPNRFRSPEPEPRISAAPDPALLARAINAGVRIIGNDPAENELRAHVAAAIYVLLNRQRAGLPITDDDGTLYVVEMLVKRLRQSQTAALVPQPVAEPSPPGFDQAGHDKPQGEK